MEHTNIVTGVAYTCGNSDELSSVFQEKGYSEPIWGTFFQFRKIGGQVMRGQKGVLLRHPAMIPDGFDEDGEKKFKHGFKHFHVFNLEQVLFHEETEAKVREELLNYS